jgi:hypothetical protein
MFVPVLVTFKLRRPRRSSYNVLANEPKVRGLKRGRGQYIFKVNKNPQHDLLRRRSKAVGPMLQDFTAC